MVRHRCDVSSDCVAQALSRVDGPATRYTLQRSNASIMKISFDFDLTYGRTDTSDNS